MVSLKDFAGQVNMAKCRLWPWGSDGGGDGLCDLVGPAGAGASVGTTRHHLEDVVAYKGNLVAIRRW